MSMRYPTDIEDSIREALRVVNYQYGITYKVMSQLSGFNESTLKGFVNQENRLPDERDTLFSFIELARRLSDEKDCDVLANIPIPGWKTLQAIEPSEVDGDLTNEIVALMEDDAELSRADKCNNVKRMKEIRIHMGKVLSQIDAEIAFKEAKQ